MKEPKGSTLFMVTIESDQGLRSVPELFTLKKDAWEYIGELVESFYKGCEIGEVKYVYIQTEINLFTNSFYIEYRLSALSELHYIFYKIHFKMVK